MKDKYLVLKVKQERNIIIIKVVNMPEYVDVNKTLFSISIVDNDDDRDNCFFLRTSSSYYCPMIISRNSSGLILPGSMDDVNEMNYASYQFNSEEEANTYLCNLSKTIKLYNEYIKYKETNNNRIATNEWVEMQ